jgi:hypothetical protein
MTLNERIEELEKTVDALTAKMRDLSTNVEDKYKNPLSIVGLSVARPELRPVDIATGLGRKSGGSVVWNDSELLSPPLNQDAPQPTKGYNKHSHSRFSGGALIVDTLELVEYVDSSIPNKHSQQYHATQPEIKTVLNSNDETVEKIGILDVSFNSDTLKWGVATYEIDVKRCYLVMRDADGNIVVDSNGNEMKSTLYSNDSTKTSVVWDINARCWRFYATYAS